MEPIVPLALLGSLAAKFLDFVKFVRAKDWNAAVTQAAAWVTGIVLVFLASGANIFEKTVVPGLDQTFADLNAASKVLVGSAIVSVLSVAFDYKKAFDGSDSAKTPPLLTDNPPPPPA